MNLQIDYLRTFIALAETKRFTKAGIQVNRSQSAISMQIKRLEDEIGKKLFERMGKTVKLTPEGNILIKYTMRIVKEHDDAIGALSKPDLEGFIRFGSPEHHTIGVLPKLLPRFASAYPDVLVEMRCENSDIIKEAVDKGELDIGLCTQISDGGHAREGKWTQRIAVGSKFFIEDVKDKLGYKAIGRKVASAGDVYQLKENKAPYNNNFDGKMSTLRQTQTRHPKADMNHLNFCMMATSVAWTYASLLEKTPSRRHVVKGRNHFAFSDVRRLIAKEALDDNFGILFPVRRKSAVNSLVAVLLRMAA